MLKSIISRKPITNFIDVLFKKFINLILSLFFNRHNCATPSVAQFDILGIYDVMVECQFLNFTLNISRKATSRRL